MTTTDIATKDRWPTLVARAALAGHQLYRTAADDGEVQYFCCRWGMVKPLGTSLDTVIDFIDRVTGKHA